MAMKSACTREEWAWLEERYPSTATDELLDVFESEFGHRPKSCTVMAHMSDRGIRRDIPRVEWDEGRIEWIRSFAPGHSESEISAEHERLYGTRLTREQVKSAKARFGARSGTHGGRFEKGSVPFTKGKKWDDYMSPEAQARSRAAAFKPGEVVDRRDGWMKPIGYERVRGDGYIEVKVRDSRVDGPQRNAPGMFNCNYRMKHRVVWEEANGMPVPDGVMLVFADGDNRNFDPSNIVAVPRDLWAVIARQGIQYCDADSLGAAMNLARLSRATAKAIKAIRRKKAGREDGGCE